MTQLFGSPALMRVLADHGAPLPTLRRVTSAGAPVPADVVAKMQALLPDDAQFWTPYGATECLPVAAIEGRELLTLRERTEQGAGTCVGRPVRAERGAHHPHQRRRRSSTGPTRCWSKGSQVGEITVAGPSATDAYFNRDAQTRLAKIREASARRRRTHRPSHGRPRLFRCAKAGCGSAAASRSAWSPRAKPLCTEQVEPVFNTHPDVRRTALVGIGERGAQRPVLCVELNAGVARAEQARIAEELRHLGEGFVHTAKVETFLFHPRFPVDIRHNAKIGREKLAAWAAKQL